MKIERRYFHYEELEEYHAGMWRPERGEKRKSHIMNAADLMRDSDAFKEAMRRALVEWPKSCEHNLTIEGANKLAWLGHAGCCIAVGSPEEATRAAWHTLDEAEQDEANRVAQEVLDEWEESYLRANGVNDLLSFMERERARA